MIICSSCALAFQEKVDSNQPTVEIENAFIKWGCGSVPGKKSLKLRVSGRPTQASNDIAI
ncbi:hypothetical protein BJP50_14735 [Paenibacillus odorifer]|nr:hypothetical protein BJP50_14735 [Paenibacillus odorifer]